MLIIITILTIIITIVS